MVLSSRPENTAGVYTQTLRQLVIWNLPDREDMFRTIRHEGFHQYFDRLVEDSPRWLNEGLAEYYENTQVSGGRSREDLPHPTHLPILKTKRPEDWKAFVFAGPGAFYRHPNAYSYAWQLVHYLLHTTRENHDRFDLLIDRLVEGKSAEEALQEAFEGIDWRTFPYAMRAHAEAL